MQPRRVPPVTPWPGLEQVSGQLATTQTTPGLGGDTQPLWGSPTVPARRGPAGATQRGEGALRPQSLMLGVSLGPPTGTRVQRSWGLRARDGQGQAVPRGHGQCQGEQRHPPSLALGPEVAGKGRAGPDPAPH